MSKEAWCGFNGWQPVAHTYDGAAYMAPILTSEEAWSKIKETISNSKPGEFYTFDADGNAKLMFVNEAACVADGCTLTIGDTPEQTSDTIMIDGKIVTREDVRKLQSGRNELAATVEALRDALDKIANWNECTSEFRMNFGSNGERDFYRGVAKQALAATPQQHLRDVRAEAVKEAAESLRFAPADGGQRWAIRYVDLMEYAERVKAGEK